MRSVMVPLDLADELTIEPSDRFSFTCDRSELDGDRNLVVAALRALGDLPPVRIELRKRIPVQAGLGGGSSDAAAVLARRDGGCVRPAAPSAIGCRSRARWDPTFRSFSPERRRWSKAPANASRRLERCRRGTS